MKDCDFDRMTPFELLETCHEKTCTHWQTWEQLGKNLDDPLDAECFRLLGEGTCRLKVERVNNFDQNTWRVCWQMKMMAVAVAEELEGDCCACLEDERDHGQ